MFLEKIGIKNFRCFDSDGIVACFNKGVNAIIGENNTGINTVNKLCILCLLVI